MATSDQPFVSVIMSSYNHGQYILEAIRSVQQQTYPHWELIINDDGSRDNTHEVLRALPADSRIRITLNETNRGASARHNESVRRARGEFISLLTSDDWYLPRKLELQVRRFQELPPDYGLVYSAGYRYYEQDGSVYLAPPPVHRGNVLKTLLEQGNFIYPITPLIQRQCLLDFPFDERFPGEGEAIYIRIALKYRFDFVPEPLVVMREHTYNSGNDIDVMLRDNLAHRERLFSLAEFPPEVQRYQNQICAQICTVNGWLYIRLREDFASGRRALLKALRYRKAALFEPRVAVGLLLSLLPPPFARRLNRLKPVDATPSGYQKTPLSVRDLRPA